MHFFFLFIISPFSFENQDEFHWTLKPNSQTQMLRFWTRRTNGQFFLDPLGPKDKAHQNSKVKTDNEMPASHRHKYGCGHKHKEFRTHNGHAHSMRIAHHRNHCDHQQISDATVRLLNSPSLYLRFNGLCSSLFHCLLRFNYCQKIEVQFFPSRISTVEEDSKSQGFCLQSCIGCFSRSRCR